MQPLDEDLVLIQDEIREFFGWDLDSDYRSAISLLEECSNPEPTISLQSKVTVVGAAVEDGYVPHQQTIVADGAIGAINDTSLVELIVTDGDGSPHIENAINKGIPICLHAHGDNFQEWKKIVSLSNSDQEILLTHQTPKNIEGMYNPGGFTDGDRAVCIALSLGAKEIELVGFSTDEVGRWSGVTDEKRKLIKLGWMNKVLEIVSLGLHK